MDVDGDGTPGLNDFCEFGDIKFRAEGLGLRVDVDGEGALGFNDICKVGGSGFRA